MTEPAEEQVDWIDADGNTLASLPRSEIRRRNLLHRTSATLVFHPDGRVFVHRRAAEKDLYPSRYDPFVAGTVVSGESWEANACREMAEELGVSGVPIHPLFDYAFRHPVASSLVRMFACVYGGKLRLQPSEVAWGSWHDEAAVAALLAQDRILPRGRRGWEGYLAQYGEGRNFARDIAPGLQRFDCAGV